MPNIKSYFNFCLEIGSTLESFSKITALGLIAWIFLLSGNLSLAESTLRKMGLKDPLASSNKFSGSVEGETVRRPLAPNSGRLNVQVLINGKRGDATLHLIRSKDGKPVKKGRTYSHEMNNPKSFDLKAGTYDVLINPVEFKGGQTRKITGIQLSSGTTIDKVVEFGTGFLSIKVTRNGELDDANVSVFDAKTKKPVAQGRTYSHNASNPKTFHLAAGFYSVKIKSNRLSGKSEQHWKNIQVGIKEKVVRAHDYQTGTLRVRSSKDKKPVDVSFSVIHRDSKQLVGRGRTNGKTREFILLPGNYSIRAKAFNLEDRSRSETDVLIEAGAVVENIIEF